MCVGVCVCMFVGYVRVYVWGGGGWENTILCKYLL